MKRFQDKGESLYDLFNNCIIFCPRCNKPTDFHKDRIACIQCGFIKQVDCISRLEFDYYLRTECCGKTLWAINLKHLEFMENYIDADLRQRLPNINRSLASRLPRWITSAKNRNEVLKAIKLLKQKLEKEGYLAKLK